MSFFESDYIDLAEVLPLQEMLDVGKIKDPK